jgi:hypothetical protein
VLDQLMYDATRAFPQALRCAIAIQEALRAKGDGLRLRIGMHQGEVVPDGDDLLGTALSSRPGWSRWPSPPESAFLPECARTPSARSSSTSKTSAVPT